MSRVIAKSGNRCPNCGGKMRLVNVNWVNKFQTPEASRYDQCVSRRKALRKAAPKSITQEMMCTSCAERTPLSAKEAKLIKSKKNPKARKIRRKRIGRLIKFLIFLAIVAAIAYFGYKYKDTIMGYLEPVKGIIDKIKDLIAKFKK